MKRNRRVKRKTRSSYQPPQKRRAVEMHRVVRRLLLIILVLVIAAVSFAWLASVYPLTFVLPTRTLLYERQSTIDYTVHLKPDTFGDRRTIPMDQVYITDTVEAIEADLTYTLHTDQDHTWRSGHQLNARVEVREAADPQQVLLYKTINLLPDQRLTHDQKPLINETVRLDLAEYAAIAESFSPPPELDVIYTLSLTLTVLTETTLAGGVYRLSDEPAMLIPLLEPTFSVSRQLPDREPIPVRQRVKYQLVLPLLPLMAYIVTISLALLILLLLLFATASRPKPVFKKRLRRMMRQARSRLMQIGDKAWEPEWCIRTTDFKSMVRTAKKLKHPLFCYVDTVQSTAYFYVYYGENNYCYIFGNEYDANGVAPAAAEQEQLPLSDDLAADDEEIPIPVLPESDDDLAPEPEQDNSPEIMLARLRMQIQ